jgi:TolB-like protein/Flp pilus assembly protein TadD
MNGARLHFENFDLDTITFELRQNGASVPIEPQVLELLVHLVRNRGRLVTRDELVETVWRGRVVSDTAVTSRIKSARQALGDDGQAQRLIRTVHGRGVRFVGTVREDAPAADPVARPPTAGLAQDAHGAVEAAVAQVMERPAIAVLPFVNLGDGPGHLADGLTDDIIAGLSAWRWFPVLSRNAVYHRNNPSIPPAERGRQLSARYVLSGTVQLAGTRMKVRASLTDAESGLVLRADSLVREMDEVFALEEELAREIVGALEPELQTAERQRVMRKPPECLTAWDLAMQASWHMHRMTPADFRAAELLASRAAERDPAWSFPYALIAFVKFQQAMRGWSSANARTAFQETHSAARAALEIDDRAWIAHALSGVGELWTNANHGRALGHLQTALTLNPTANWTYHFHGCVSGFAGHLDNAQTSGARIFRIDPHYIYTAVVKADLALWAMLEGRLDDAVRLIDEALDRDPGYGRGVQRLAAIHGLRGDRAKAQAAVRRLSALGQPTSRDYFLSSYPFLCPNHRETFMHGLGRAGVEM